MIALLQRVTSASVTIEDRRVAEIDAGLVVLLGVQRGDDDPECRRLLERVLGYRVFADAQQRMNLSLLDTGGALLVVSQFTLAAETRRGTRPGFSTAAPPEEGRRLYEAFVAAARARVARVETGSFGAYMQLSLVNDGPVTFWLEAPPGTP